jgi:acetylornithine deacetylase/succinyl-diaminopimelate desuccinylase-like protein
MYMTAIHENPAALLQQLIRFDTTNPPGNERACIQYIAELLARQGLESTLLARDPERPNLIARLPGRGDAPPLLLYGHVDVVTTANQAWDHPPFGGELIDGVIWGRGALDMKGGVAMLISAFMRAQAEELRPGGDLILAIVSDEENGGYYGARYLAENHAGRFAGVRHAIGEFGGFSMHLAGQRFYPIAVSEKQICWMKATFRGPAGHGSRPLPGGAMTKMARFVQMLDQQPFPTHITPVAQLMIEHMSAAFPEPVRSQLLALLDPAKTDLVLAGLGPNAQLFSPIFHNTVSPTIVHGGDKVNVIPSQVVLEMDGRLLPGFKPDNLVALIKEHAGDDLELEVVAYDEGPPAPDMSLFDELAAVLREADPAGIPVPYMLTGVTDGRFFARLGIQTYGYLPMNLPADFAFANTIHAANERIPAESVQFGTDVIYRFLGRY